MHILSKFKNSILWIYLAVLVIPILVVAMVYANFVRAASVKSEKDFSSALTQVKNYVDSELNSSDKIFNQITLFQNIQCLYTNQSPLSAQQLYYLYKLMPSLQAFSVGNSRIDSVYLYFPTSDFIISGAGSFDSQTIGQWFKNTDGLSKQKIVDLIGKRNNAASFVPISYTKPPLIYSLSQEQQLIAYIRPILPVRNQTPPIVVIVFIKQADILNAYNNLFMAAYGNISIIDSQNRFLFCAAPGFLADKNYDFFHTREDQGKSFTIGYNKTRYRVTNMKSDIADWDYILTVPENVYSANLIETKNAMLICILIYIMAVLFVGWYFYRVNYKPIHKLINQLKNIRSSTKDNANGISYIEDSVINLLDDNQKITGLLEKQKANLKQGIMSRLLNGGEAVSQCLASASEAGILLDKQYGFVFILYSQNEKGDSNGIGCNVGLCMELEKQFADIEYVYFLRTNSMLIGLANTDMDIPLMAARAMHICREMEQSVGAGLRLSLAFSARHESIDGYGKAYAEALEVKEYQTYLGDSSILFYHEMVAGFQAANPYIGHIETELQIINHIKSQEYEPAIELINKQMTCVLMQKTLPLALVKCRMFGVIDLLLSIISEMRSMYDFKFMEEINAAEVLLSCKSVQELQSHMNDIFNWMRDYIQQKEKELDSSRMRAIMDFVKENYNRPDMSIMYLSQVFNRNESYISRSFKRYVGMGFLDYLHALRIVEAKGLLMEGKHIKDVALMVGYTNDITLIRAFKRYEGMTPGKFKARDNLKTGQETDYGV